MKTAIVVFVKHPQAGRVKTRLIPDLGEKSATELYACFAQDVIEQAVRVSNQTGSSLWLMVTPAEGISHYRDIVAKLGQDNHTSILAQRGPDLGARLDDAFQRALEVHDGALVIGSDQPMLEDDILIEAIQKLSAYDAVLGPAEDGGYYLIGLKKANKLVFDEIPWSSDRVCAETLNRFEKLNLTHFSLPVRYDVDTIDEIRRLKTDMAETAHSSHTKLYLNELALG